MMELHHIMMLIHHKLYDSYKLYYCQDFPRDNLAIDNGIVELGLYFHLASL